MRQRHAIALVVASLLVALIGCASPGEQVITRSQPAPDQRAAIRAEVAAVVQMQEENMEFMRARLASGRADPRSVSIAECDLLRQQVSLAILDQDVDDAIEHARRIVEIRRRIVESVQANAQQASADDLRGARIDFAEAKMSLLRLQDKTPEALLREAMAYRP